MALLGKYPWTGTPASSFLVYCVHYIINLPFYIISYYPVIPTPINNTHYVSLQYFSISYFVTTITCYKKQKGLEDLK